MKSKGPTRTTPGSVKSIVSDHAMKRVGSGRCGGRCRMQEPYSMIPSCVE